MFMLCKTFLRVCSLVLPCLIISFNFFYTSFFLLYVAYGCSPDFDVPGIISRALELRVRKSLVHFVPIDRKNDDSWSEQPVRKANYNIAWGSEPYSSSIGKNEKKFGQCPSKLKTKKIFKTKVIRMDRISGQRRNCKSITQF